MTEPDPAAVPPTGHCPWCSAELVDATAPTCPSCGAALREQLDGDLPGVTQVDARAVVGQVKARRSSVRALIGITDEETEGSPVGVPIVPPSEEVRREMLRLRIDALQAELEARAAALAAERAAAAALATGPAGAAKPGGGTTPPGADPEADPPA